MAREYVISGDNLTMPAAVGTLVAAMPSATVGFEVIRAWVSWSGAATSAQQRISLGTKVTAFQTVTSVTPQKLKINDPTSGIVGATTIAAGKCGVAASAEGAGTMTVIWSDAFNVLSGWLWVPTPDERVVMPPASSSAFCLYFPVSPGTYLIGWNAGIVIKEI